MTDRKCSGCDRGLKAGETYTLYCEDEWPVRFCKKCQELVQKGTHPRVFTSKALEPKP